MAFGQSINEFCGDRTGQRGRPRLNDRIVFEGIIYILRTGVAWRDLPEYFGNWKSIYTRFRRWKGSGLLERIFRDSQKEDSSQCRYIDSTCCKVHKHSNGYSNESDSRCIGSTKGGRNTKIHAVVDGSSRVCSFLLSPGNDSDIKHAPELVEDISDKRIVADKGYTSGPFRRHLEEMNNRHCIAQRDNEKCHEDFHAGYYKRRHKVENFFQRIKEFKRIATRYDTTASSFAAFVSLAAAWDWNR